MLILVQVTLMVGILLMVILFRDNFSTVTSSFVSGFGAEDIQVNQEEAKPEQAPAMAPTAPEGERLPPLE